MTREPVSAPDRRLLCFRRRPFAEPIGDHPCDLLLFFSSTKWWELPWMPMSGSRMKSLSTPACFRNSELQ
jgi:hypothetical protein